MRVSGARQDARKWLRHSRRGIPRAGQSEKASRGPTVARAAHLVVLVADPPLIGAMKREVGAELEVEITAHDVGVPDCGCDLGEADQTDPGVPDPGSGEVSPGAGETTPASGGPTSPTPPVVPSTGPAPTPPTVPGGALPEPSPAAPGPGGMMPMGMPMGAMMPPGGAAGGGRQQGPQRREPGGGAAHPAHRVGDRQGQ